jgi:hypothetical protein
MAIRPLMAIRPPPFPHPSLSKKFFEKVEKRA